MPIRRFLEDRAFDPELVAAMGESYVTLCVQLKLNPVTDDPMTRRVAAVIQSVEDGERSEGGILLLSLAKLGIV